MDKKKLVIFFGKKKKNVGEGEIETWRKQKAEHGGGKKGRKKSRRRERGKSAIGFMGDKWAAGKVFSKISRF